MPKLSPEPPREVIRKLRALGFEGPYGGGKHLFMRHPDSRLKIPIPMHQSRDLPVGTVRAIVRIVGLTVEEWFAL
ncbi:MAG: type II toxin-antitoxin system HicA family toxin [Anaerolineae bacterium]|nr:type II toxin-antitoxin system HicA family toxin [Anaerolineae bacterium]